MFFGALISGDGGGGTIPPIGLLAIVGFTLPALKVAGLAVWGELYNGDPDPVSLLRNPPRVVQSADALLVLAAIPAFHIVAKSLSCGTDTSCLTLGEGGFGMCINSS